MKHYKICLLLFCLCYSFSVPIMGDSFVRFNNGFERKFSNEFIYFSKYEDAIDKGLPISFKESVQIIKEWNRVIFMKELYYFQGKELQLTIYDNDGNALSPSLLMSYVDFLPLIKKNIFLLTDYYQEDNGISFIFDKDGRLIKRIEHPPATKFGHTEDENLIWLISYLPKPVEGYKYIVQVYSVKGELVLERKINKDKTQPFRYNGKNYQLPKW